MQTPQNDQTPSKNLSANSLLILERYPLISPLTLWFEVSITLILLYGQGIQEWTNQNLRKTAFKKFNFIHSWIPWPILGCIAKISIE